MRWLALALSLYLSCLAVAGEPRGWRVDGTGHAAATPPERWQRTWQVPLEGWSNATPVRLGGLVCTLAEPVTVSCHDAATGAVAWSAAHPVVDALPPAEQPDARRRVEAAVAAERELEGLRGAVSALQRDKRRRPDAADVDAALTAAQARMAEVKGLLEDARWLLTPPDQEIMGYTTPTPVVTDDGLVVLLANGVAAAHAPDGRVRWRRWLGEGPTHGMRGYDRGHASSPVLVGGTLVVPWGHLRGLDPATGATRWEDPRPWRDYGTPGFTTVGGVGVVLTPDGRMLRARDGLVLQEGLGDITYVGPYVRGDRAWWIGGPASDATARKGAIPQHGWRLVAAGDRVRAEPLFAVSLELKDVFYTGPVEHDGRLYSVDKSGVLRVLDAATGALLSTTDLLPRLGGWTYPSPTVAGGLVWVGSGRGRFLGLTPGATPEVAREVDLAVQTRSTPWFDGGAVFVRTLDGLERYDGR